MERYPQTHGEDTSEEQKNPAIRLYGRRLYKDQTPVEYLAEFLLVFASQKGPDRDNEFRFRIRGGSDTAYYWPNDLLALKLFSFFPNSKLETRHHVHHQAYIQAIGDIKAHITGEEDEKNEIIRLLQSLFSGFVGVAKNRTWVTHSFLPASPSLLAREVNWLHSKASKDDSLDDWNDSEKYFDTTRHNFMARGGELLFLQLAHLFSADDHDALDVINANPSYKHLSYLSIGDLQDNLEQNLRAVLEGAVTPIQELSTFLESSLSDLSFDSMGTQASLGWAPKTSLTEAFLFAHELQNISQSTLGALEKIELLELLVCMQVLRSLCFQAQRVDGPDRSITGFIGGYVWIPAAPYVPSGSSSRKLAQSSFDQIEEVLYRVIRKVAQPNEILNQADKHGFQIFRKIGKEIGLVVPRTGGGQRFALSPTLLRFLVAALIKPGERVRLTEFYARAFSHYGIALGDLQLAHAMEDNEDGRSRTDYAAVSDTAWVEEALQQGGLLVGLSDAVSIVHNPNCKG